MFRIFRKVHFIMECIYILSNVPNFNEEKQYYSDKIEI